MQERYQNARAAPGKAPAAVGGRPGLSLVAFVTFSPAQAGRLSQPGAQGAAGAAGAGWQVGPRRISRADFLRLR